MKRKSLLVALVAFAVLGLAAGAAVTAAPGPAPLTLSPQTVAAGGACFPIDECNYCCLLPNGHLICTARLCS
jgi:hypothetical protein